MKIIFFILVLLCFASLNGCKTSEVTAPKCSLSEQMVACNGGFGYWIGDVFSSSDSALAITGVIKDGHKSKQWIAFFDRELNTVLAEHSFENLFRPDEHNAPAVLSLDNNEWLVARTGHDDTIYGKQDAIEITHFDVDYKVSHQQILRTETGATYAQLQKANGSLYLLTRDTKMGWGIFTSLDSGISWSIWQAVNLPAGIAYALLKKENVLGAEFERLILHSGNHPIDNKQTIAYSYFDLNINDPKLTEDNNQNVGDIVDRSNANFNVLHSLITKSSTETRFLDAYNRENNICHLYSSATNETNVWQLNVLVSGENKSIKNYLVGNFTGMLGDNKYITGASIKGCQNYNGGLIELLVAHKVDNGQRYQIDTINIDAQSGDVLSIDNLYSSLKALYRPVYIEELNYVMFNESEYWHTYENWQAAQKIIKLP